MTRHDQWKFLDRLRRRAYIKQELRRVMLRSITRAAEAPLAVRYSAQCGLSHIPRNSTKNKIQNRCVVSGRNWNVLRKAQYSRFVFRERSYFSYLPGVRRASW